MDILKDLSDAEVRTLARSATQKHMAGIWVLTAPDGQTWTGESPIACVTAEIQSRVPPQVALARIRQSMMDDDQKWDSEAERITREALGDDVTRPINPHATSIDDL